MVSALFLDSCSQNEYNIIVTSDNPEWGRATGSGSYLDGAEILLYAYAEDGYRFAKWHDGNRENPRVVVVTKDETYSASFEVDPEYVPTYRGKISQNTTWPDRGLEVDYIIDGWIEVADNALLTIEPGVTVKFIDYNSGIEVDENAGLNMVGTAEKHIKFIGESDNQANGSWDKIQLKSKRNENQWEYVDFIRGGVELNEWDAVIDLEGAQLSMKNCVVNGSRGCGIDVEGETMFTAFENNTIKNCEDFPIVFEKMETVFSLSSNNNFTNNEENYVCIYATYGILDDNQTLKNLGIPYYFVGDMTFLGTETITIEPGTEMIFRDGKFFAVDTFIKIIANGTAFEPIIFRGETSSTLWKGVEFRSREEGNILNHCIFSEAGVSYNRLENSLLYIHGDAKMTLKNCTFENSKKYGVMIKNISNWGNIIHSNNTFRNCYIANVRLEDEGEFGGISYSEDNGNMELDKLPGE